MAIDEDVQDQYDPARPNEYEEYCVQRKLAKKNQQFLQKQKEKGKTIMSKLASSKYRSRTRTSSFRPTCFWRRSLDEVTLTAF